VSDLDRAIESLLGGDATQKEEVVAAGSVLIEAGWEPMMDGSLPVGVGERLALSIRDRDHRRIAELAIQRADFREV
jgi:hypothetical protein